MIESIKDIAPLSLQVSAKIKKNIAAMLFHKIGTVIVFSTDNMMISKFVGLAAVGLYSNYTLVINSISGLVNRIFSAITASVGNLALSRDTVHIEMVLYRVLFLNFWIRGFCSIALFCLFPSFLCLWIGDQFLLSTETLFIIVLNFYIGTIGSTLCVTWSLCGLIQGRGIGSFVVRLVMCCIVPNTVYLLVFYKTKELRYYVGLVKKKFSKQKKHENKE